LTLQCLALLGGVAGTCGDVRGMRAVSSEALAAAADHGWQTTTWSGAAAAMLAYTELLRSAAADAQRRTESRDAHRVRRDTQQAQPVRRRAAADP
jgi:LuxR family maltose regulon positive regulatory protein